MLNPEITESGPFLLGADLSTLKKPVVEMTINDNGKVIGVRIKESGNDE